MQVCEVAGLAFGCMEILGFSPQDLAFFLSPYVAAYSSGVAKGPLIEK